MLKKSVPKALILLTKPAQQADTLLNALADHGVAAINLPTIDIQPPSNPSALESAITHIAEYHCCIFNSANAVNPRLVSQIKKGDLFIAAIGPATAKALSEQGISVDLVASPPNSEGLLSSPHFNHRTIAQQRVALFCGERPKSLLRETLQQRQATVDEIFCYRRQCAAPNSDAITAIVEQPITCIACASRDSLQNLFEILSKPHKQWLLTKTLIVISEDMKHIAEKLGWQPQQVIITANATNSAIVNAIQSHTAN